MLNVNNAIAAVYKRMESAISFFDAEEYVSTSRKTHTPSRTVTKGAQLEIAKAAALFTTTLDKK